MQLLASFLLNGLGVGLERYALVGDDEAGRRLHADLTRARGAPFVIVDVLPRGLEAAELAIRAMGITFTVYSEAGNIDRDWPFDVIPRVVSSGEWERICHE